MSNLTITETAGKELSKSQQEFNRLTNKTIALRKELQDYKDAIEATQQRYSIEYLPLLQKHWSFIETFLFRLDSYYNYPEFKKKEKGKISEFIVQQLLQCPDELSEPLKELYNRHSDSNFDDDLAGAMEENMEDLILMAEIMLDIEIDRSRHFETPNDLQEYIHEKLAEKDQSFKEKEEENAKKKAGQPKTAKQIAQEQKRADKEAQKIAEEKNISRSVREVYMDLAKSFHPDLEPDAEKKQRRTEIMQQVTAAYEDNDLLALLELQMAFERLDNQKLTEIPEQRLRMFNKILREQQRELAQEVQNEKYHIAELLNKPFNHIKGPHLLNAHLESNIRQIKQKTKAMQAEINSLKDINSIKSWLKYF